MGWEIENRLHWVKAQMLNSVTKFYINGYKIPITGGLRYRADPASPPDRSIFQNIIYPMYITYLLTHISLKKAKFI